MDPFDTTNTFIIYPTGIRFINPVGHTSAILGTTISPDGTRLVTASADNSAKVWDLNTGFELHTLHGHKGPVSMIEYSPDGKTIVSASWDRTVALWDAKTYRFIRVFRGHEDFVTMVHFSPDGKKIISASEDSTAKVWDVQTGQLLYTLKGHAGGVKSARFSHHGDLIATTSADHNIRLWKANDGKLLHAMNDSAKNDNGLFEAIFQPNDRTLLAVADGILKFHDPLTGHLMKSIRIDTGLVNSVVYNKDGDRIAVTSTDGKLRVLDSRTGDILRTFQSGDNNPILAKFSPDGKQKIFAAGESGNLSIWDLSKGHLLHTIKAHSRAVFTAAFTGDGKRIVTAGLDNTAKLWDAATGQLITEYNGFTKEIYAPRYSPDGSKAIMAGTNKVVKIWDIGKGIFTHDLRGHQSGITSASFSADGKFILTTSYDKTAKLWSSETGNLVSDFRGHQDVVNAGSISPDGRYVATASRDKTARIWSADDGTLIAQLKGHTKNILTVSYSPDGSRIVTASTDSTAMIWDSGNGKLLFVLKGHTGPLNMARFSPDGKWVATGSQDHFIKIWDAGNGNLLHSMEHSYNIRSITISPDSRKLVATSDDGMARIWDAASGILVRDISGNQTGAFSSDISSDGRKAVTTSMDVKVWDMESGNLSREFYKSNTLIGFAKFSPDAKKIITTSWENTARVWDTETGKLLYSFLVIDSTDHFIQLPDGYYFSTPSAVRKLHYVNDDFKVLTFDQLDLKYNRPDKVLESMGTADTLLVKSYRNAYRKRMRRLGVDTSAFRDGFSIPEGDILNREKILFEQTKEELSIHLWGKDSIYTLDRLNVWVNESPVFGKMGIRLGVGRRHVVDTSLFIRLSQGNNRIEASVINSNGTESYRLPLFVKYVPSISKQEHTLFIGIGIDRFKDEKYNLTYSTKDIRDLSLALKGKYKDNITIDTLFNEKVTVPNVMDLKKKLRNTSVNDKVIIAYSGHGLLNDSLDYFLSTYSVDFHHPETGGLPYDILENLFDGIPARKRLLLVDACHSGEVDKEESGRQAIMADSMGLKKGSKGGIVVPASDKHLGLDNSIALLQSLFVNLNRSTGVIVIAAAAGNQYALEGVNNIDNGVFTYCILDAIRANPTMKVSNLKDLVSNRVAQLTNGMQRPTSRSENLTLDWVLW